MSSCQYTIDNKASSKKFQMSLGSSKEIKNKNHFKSFSVNRQIYQREFLSLMKSFWIYVHSPGNNIQHNGNMTAEWEVTLFKTSLYIPVLTELLCKLNTTDTFTISRFDAALVYVNEDAIELSESDQWSLSI